MLNELWNGVDTGAQDGSHELYYHSALRLMRQLGGTGYTLKREGPPPQTSGTKWDSIPFFIQAAEGSECNYHAKKLAVYFVPSVVSDTLFVSKIKKTIALKGTGYALFVCILDKTVGLVTPKDYTIKWFPEGEKVSDYSFGFGLDVSGLFDYGKGLEWAYDSVFNKWVDETLLGNRNTSREALLLQAERAIEENSLEPLPRPVNYGAIRDRISELLEYLKLDVLEEPTLTVADAEIVIPFKVQGTSNQSCAIEVISSAFFTTLQTRADVYAALGIFKTIFISDNTTLVEVDSLLGELRTMSNEESVMIISGHCIPVADFFKETSQFSENAKPMRLN